MCREFTREPAWVAAIRCAVTRGWVDVDSVVEEANLVAGRERTVRDVLRTMVDRDMLREAPDFEQSGRYLVGPVLYRSAPSPSSIGQLSTDGAHRWSRAQDD